MKNKIIKLLLLSLLFMSCGKNDIISDLEHIKYVGDKDTKLAMCMLDSLSVEIKNNSTYCQMKYELLKMRLQDKSNVVPVSNKMAEHLLQYFVDNGTQIEKQEAYYYAGSVYRDLQDVPRALENFLNSVEIATESNDCDSVMLRNTYSNLSYLFYYVQDYTNALDMARKEYAIAEKIHAKTINVIMHLGNSYVSCDKAKDAIKYFDEALAMFVEKKDMDIFPFIYVLLYQYTELGDINKAKKCFDVIKSTECAETTDYACNALAKYYDAIDMQDSSIVYYNKIIDNAKDERNIYDASKALFHVYLKMNNKEKACVYGEKFIKLTEELDLGKNQELAATVNNRYKYHLDQKLVQAVKHERTLYMRAVVGLAVFILLLVLVMTIFYTRKKNAMLRKQLAAVNELSSVRMRYNEMQEDLDATIRQLNSVKAELDANDLRLKQANADIDRYTAELNAARKSLEEKLRQSQSLMQMLHRTELSSEAEDVIVIVEEAACGKRKLYAKEWQQIYSAVDSLWHDFRKTLVARLGTFTEQQMQVCYLMRIGLNNPQICSVADISRTTIWRWTKAYAWIYKLPKVCDLM